MFEQFAKSDAVDFTKALVLCSIGAGIGVGTCGIGVLIGNERVSPIVIETGAFLFWSSLLGMLIIGLLSIARLILGRLRK